MNSRWLQPIARGAAAIFAVAGCVVLASCGVGDASFLDPRGSIAAEQRRWFVETILIMLVVVGPVLVLAPWFAWRYRRRGSNSPYRPDWGAASLKLELLVWGPPTLIVAALAWLVIGPESTIDPYRPIPSAARALPVEVVALDWKWLFIYPEQGIATVDQLAFPVDRPVSLLLTSDATMQSFFVPALGSQIYAMAGMVTRLHLDARRPATLVGENTQYNGDGFDEDRFQVAAMSPRDFSAWADRVRARGTALDGTSYDAIRAQGTLKAARQALPPNGAPDGTIWLSSVPPRFFEGVVASYAGGAAGMTAMRSGKGDAP